MLYRRTDATKSIFIQHGGSYIDEEGNVYWPLNSGRIYDKDGKHIDIVPITKMVYDNKEEYERDFPGGFGGFLDPALHCKEEIFYLQTYPNYRVLKGSFLVVTVRGAWVHPKNPKYNYKPHVVVNDGDDFYIRRHFETFEQAKQAGEDLKALAPFHMDELKSFGYEWD